MFSKGMSLREKVAYVLESILSVDQDEKGDIVVVFPEEDIKELEELLDSVNSYYT